MFKRVMILSLLMNFMLNAYEGDERYEAMQVPQEMPFTRLNEQNAFANKNWSFLSQGREFGKICLNKVEQYSRKLEALYQHDVELKGTWSYQTLVIARTVAITTEQQLKSATCLSFMKTLGSVIVQHYSPQIFYTVGKFIIPKALKDDYEQAVDNAFRAVHAYDIIQNPMKHIFAYTCGYIGAYLIAQLLEDENETLCGKEFKGAAYFCCREAGFNLHQTQSRNILSFIQSLPTCLPVSLFTQEEHLTIDPDLLEQKLNQVKEMDDNINVKGRDGKLTHVVFPLCEKQQLRERAIKKFNTTVIPRLLNAHLKALNESLPLVIIWGQHHYSCGCYWQERELLKWAKSIGIDDFVIEAGEERLYRWMQFATELTEQKRTVSSLPTNGDLPAVARLMHARQLNYTITPGDPHVDKELPLWDAFPLEYFTVLIAVKNGKISRHQQIKIMGYPVDLTKCPDFFGRDREMASVVKAKLNSMLGLYGGAHLGGIHHFLGNHNNAHVIYITCYDTSETYTFFNRFVNYFSMRGKRDILNMVFGRGCGDKYIQAHEYSHFFHISPDVIKSSTPNDYLFDSQSWTG